MRQALKRLGSPATMCAHRLVVDVDSGLPVNSPKVQQNASIAPALWYAEGAAVRHVYRIAVSHSHPYSNTHADRFSSRDSILMLWLRLGGLDSRDIMCLSHLLAGKRWAGLSSMVQEDCMEQHLSLHDRGKQGAH